MAEGMERFKFLILDILQTIVVAMAIFFIVWQLLLQPHKVDGRSMEPTFCNTEMILTDKISYKFREPERYEVIVFQSPTKGGRELIKRLVGLPGDTVGLQNGKITVNGEPIDEPYLPSGLATNGSDWLREGESRSVPEGQYVAIGDNRDHSEDSRRFGLISREKLRGRVWIRYWPPQSVGIIPKGNAQTGSRQSSCS